MSKNSIAKSCDGTIRNIEALIRTIRRQHGVSRVDVELQYVAGEVRIRLSIPELGKIYHASSGEELAKALGRKNHLKLVPKKPAEPSSGNASSKRL